MEKRYISENRYKKTAKRMNRKRNFKVNKTIQKKKKSNKKKNYKSAGKFVRFVFCLIVLFIIAIVTRIITKNEEESFIPTIFNNEVVENTNSINIAVYDDVNIGANNSVITELEQYIYPMLLRIDDNYLLKYEIISSISKMNNKEYEIELNGDSNVSAQDVKNTIDSIITSKNKYYSKVENVDKVEVKSSTTVYIYLKNEDEYFVYNLNIPIYKTSVKYSLYSVDRSSTSSKLVLSRNDGANKKYIKHINVIKLNSHQEAIDKYKNGKIDVFFSNSNSVVKTLGKYDYDIKSYNNGEGIFLMFNPQSTVTKIKYVRQIIAYSINREGILSDVGNYDGKIIDLPYIYDEEKYKYDVYAADNIILSNGYKKQGLYYIKSGAKLTLDLVVNKDEQEKVNIANKIKSDLLKAGINVNISKLSDKEINKKLQAGNYDMILANIYMNENPNITYITENINLSDEINKQITEIKTGNIQDLSDNILKLKASLSGDIGIYGIYSKQTYIIYKKGIDLFKNINYMGLFNNYFKIGGDSNEIQ